VAGLAGGAGHGQTDDLGNVRLFVAVELHPDVVLAAARIVDTLRRRTARLAPRARVTWVPAERMHVTLAFIGSVDRTRAASVTARLAPPLPAAGFDLTIAGLGAFPGKGPPRVLWAGVTAGREQLADLEREISGRLAELQVPDEGRPYHPHLTLARVRDPAGLRVRALLDDGVAITTLGTTRVEAITLFESRLSPKGATYVACQRTRMAAGRGTPPGVAD
jgi:2'-5' RNA ligase